MTAEERVKQLETAIKMHRSQKADDRCIEDDDRLYAVLGDGIPCDRRVGNKLQMLNNCARFIENRCQEGGWKTYSELETKLQSAEEKNFISACVIILIITILILFQLPIL